MLTPRLTRPSTTHPGTIWVQIIIFKDILGVGQFRNEVGGAVVGPRVLFEALGCPQGQVKKSPRGLLTLQVSWVHELSSPLSPWSQSLRDAWIGVCPHKVPSPIRASVTGSDLGSSQLSS